MTKKEKIFRTTKEVVKTAKRRKNSSTRWLQRQINDPYVRQAQAEGRRSRAAYKIIQIDEKFNIFMNPYGNKICIKPPANAQMIYSNLQFRNQFQHDLQFWLATFFANIF